MLHPKQARPKTHEGMSALVPPRQCCSNHATDDAPIEAGKSLETAESMSASFRMIYLSVYDLTAASPTTEEEVVKRQSGHQKGGKGNVLSVLCLYWTC